MSGINIIGAFMVRRSKKNGDEVFTLSIKCEHRVKSSQVKHYRTKNGKISLFSSDKNFDSIIDLIEYYSSERPFSIPFIPH